MRRYKYLWLISCLGLALTIGAFAFVSKSLKAADITLIDSTGHYYTTGYQTAIITTAGITLTINQDLSSFLGVQGAEPPAIAPPMINRTVLKPNTDTFQIIATDVNGNLSTLQCFDHLGEITQATSNQTFTTSQLGLAISGAFQINTTSLAVGKYFYVFEATDSGGLKGYAFAWINVTTDATAPTVAIPSPTSNSTYPTNSSSITFGGNGIG